MCMEPFADYDNIEMNGCGHKFHIECFQEWADSQIIEAKVPVKCPFAGCEEKANKNEIQASVTPAMFLKYQKFAIKKKLDQNEKIVFCPTPGCEFFFEHNGESTFKCPECAKSYCRLCKLPAHDTLTCEQAAKTNANSDEEKKMMAKFAKVNGLKACPGCKTWTEKKHGCDYIDCRCGTYWCYKCVAKYDTKTKRCKRCGM